MRVLRLAAVVVSALAVLPATAQLTLDRPLIAPEPYLYDSGFSANASPVERSLGVAPVSVPGAAWLRLYFGAVELPAGSFLRITSELDREVQLLDAATLAAWGNTSAYFNGSTVVVELVGGPRTLRNRLVIDRLAWESGAASPAGGCGICGNDDRIPSLEDFAARLLPAGCSATVWNTDSCMVSAGHCVTGSMVMEFKVPASLANCNIVHPPVADQFPVQTSQSVNGGVGNDWAVMTMGTNSLGQKPIDRYGVFRPIAAAPPTTGDPLAIWGYGVDEECVRSQVQQNSTGTVTSVGGNFINHNVDATFGNSGSSIIRNAEILGIATHCPCPNWGTRVDQAAFAAAREDLCPAEQNFLLGTLTGFNVILGTLTGGGLGDMTSSNNSYLRVQSVAQGVRQNALTEVTATGPLSVVTALQVRYEVGAAPGTPIFAGLQLFDFDAGIFRILDIAVASTSGDTVRTLSIPNPNAYIDPSGNLRLRIYETARLADFPSPITKTIDQIEISMLP